jgi:hypothetical protein
MQGQSQRCERKTRVGGSPPKPMGRARIRNRRTNSCARSPWFSSGQDPPPSSAATSRRFEMATGLHLAWRPTSCDFYCSAGGRNWPHRFTCRSAPDRGRAHQSWMALIIERPSSRGGASSGNRKPHRITTGNDRVVSFKTTHRNRCHPRLVAPGTLRRVHRRERDEMISSRPQT